MKGSIWQCCLVWIRVERLETEIQVRMAKARKLIFVKILLCARSLANHFAMSVHFILTADL